MDAVPPPIRVMVRDALLGHRECRVLSNQSRSVLLALTLLVDAAGQDDPAVEDLEALTGLDRRTVRRAVADLEDLGLIRVDRNPGHRNRYLLTPHGKPPRQVIPYRARVLASR